MKIVFIDHKSKIREKKRKLEQKELGKNCLYSRNPVFKFGCGLYMYHFLDAFTTYFLSFATLYIDVKLSTLPVEQGHKKRHCKLDNFATV